MEKIADNIFKMVKLERRREHYKAKYLTLKGYCYVLFVAIIIMAGITICALHGVNSMQKQLAERNSTTILPNGFIRK